MNTPDPSTCPAVRVSLVAVVAGDTMVATGRLVERVGGSLQVALDDDVELTSGASVVVVVHGEPDEPDEVLLAIGLATDATADPTSAGSIAVDPGNVAGHGAHATMQRTQRLRVVERRD